MLMRRWERARQGDGQLALIVGEPGLGKSRLIEEFHTRLHDTPHTWSMELLSAIAEHAAASDRRMGPTTFRRRRRAGGAAACRLENTLTLIKLDPAENVPFLAPLLDIPLPKERVFSMRRRSFGEGNSGR